MGVVGLHTHEGRWWARSVGVAGYIRRPHPGGGQVPPRPSPGYGGDDLNLGPAPASAGSQGWAGWGRGSARGGGGEGREGGAGRRGSAWRAGQGGAR